MEVGDNVIVAWTGNGWRHPDYWKVDSTGTPTYLDAWHREERVALARITEIPNPLAPYRFTVQFLDVDDPLGQPTGSHFHIDEEFCRHPGWIPEKPEQGDF